MSVPWHNLIIDEPGTRYSHHPFSVDLAKIVKVAPAIMLQVFNYKLISVRDNHFKQINGYHWFHRPMKKMCEDFPYWDEAFIRKTLSYLIEKGYVLIRDSDEYDDREPSWYTINYEKVFSELNMEVPDFTKIEGDIKSGKRRNEIYS